MINFETDGACAIITIDRPEARNAVNAVVAQGIEDAIDELEARDDLWVGILASTGPVFCAGADLKEVAAGNFQALFTERGGFGGIVTRERTKPLIAAVDGAAVAGGTEIVLSCDLRVATANSSFGIPEVKRSLVAGALGLARLPRAIPQAIAMELALTGDTIDAERAHHFGLINALCEPGTALAAALELADRINANAPLAVRQSRKLILETPQLPDDEALKAAGRAQAVLAGTKDFAEGPRAFIEKRPPRWLGH